MKVTKHFCDLCKEEGLAMTLKPLKISIFCESQNPLTMKTTVATNYQDACMELADVCEKCRRSVCEAIADQVLRINPELATA